MPNNYRLAKVSSLLKKEITLILQNDLENDLIRDHFVNISKIDLSGDLQHCKIYITSTAQEKVRKEIVARLNIAKSSIRHSLVKRIEMRRVPEIIFKDDVVLDKGLSVLKLLDELKNQIMIEIEEVFTLLKTLKKVLELLIMLEKLLLKNKLRNLKNLIIQNQFIYLI